MAFPSNSHRLDFLPIEDGGSLEIAYEGPPLDLQTLGVLHLNLQDIVDHVAFAVLRDEELIGPYGQRRRSSAPFRRAYDGRIVRAQPTKIEIGSLYEQIAFFVPAVLADPDVRSVLQNLAANIVWAIGYRGRCVASFFML